MPDAIITSTASTFGTISGVFSADQSTISGTISGIIPGTLTGSVGVPGPAGPAGIGLPAGGTSGQFLQKTSGVDYATDWVTVNLTGLATESWVTAGFYPLTGNPSSFITASALTPYLTSATAASTYQTLAGMSSYLTTSAAAAGYYPLSGNPSGFLTAASLSGYATESWVTGQGYITSAALTPYLTSATASTTYQTLSGMSDYLAKADNLGSLTNFATARTNLGLGSLAVVNDAPSDGSQYARKNGAWDVVSVPASYITSVSSPLSVTTGNLSIDLSAYAPLASPLFTGDARAVTPAFGDNDTSISTTAFVQAALAGGTAVARNLEVEVRNQSGSTIAAGSIVYISGATGNKPLITLAQANNDANSAQTIGFVKTAIANNGTGFVIVRGELENIDTSALTEGVQLYLSPTVAGSWTTTKPSAPQHLVYVGIVIRSHPTQGVILVAVQNGYELGEIHDVALSGLANNDLLAYESSTDLWKNKTYSALGLLTSSDAASTYYPLTGNPSGFITSSALTGYATESWVTSQGYITSAALSPYLLSSTAASTYFTIASAAGKANLSGATFTGLVGTVASTTTTAGLNIPHGTAPTTPVNGDIWTTTSGFLWRQNGTTQQAVDIGGTQTISGTKTFSAASLTLGNSTTAGTINIGTGAVTTGSKIINIGTGSTGGSVAITLGTAAMTGNTTFNGGGQFQVNNNTVNIGTNTATSSATFAGGATISGSTKTVAIGSGGVAGSTTNINLGTVDGGAATVTTNALLVTRASATTGAGLRILPGTAPSAPVNGDVWTDTAGVYARINGATQNLTPPALATLSEARQFTNDTKVMSPRDTLWSMLSQDFIDIDGPSMTVTNTGTITYVNIGQLSRNIRPGNAGACSSRIRTFGISQVDQTWTATSRAQPSAFLNFSLRSIHSGRSTTSGVTDANYTCAVYYGKAEADGVGDLTRRGYGWKMVGGAGSRFLQLQAHNGTTLSSVTSSFAVTAGVAFDWDIESDGAGNVTLYVNGSSVATSTGGPTGSVNITGVAWQEEVVAAAALSSPFMDFTNSRGRFIVINTW